jgi:hypothetical protein
MADVWRRPYRIAVGPRAGQDVFTPQTVPVQPEGAGRHGAAESGGLSLHARLDLPPGERAKLERLCRYVSRPPASGRVLQFERNRRHLFIASLSSACIPA